MSEKVEHIIETKDLVIGYKANSIKTIVQSNLNLSLKKGELCCLIGPNGVGKSTLLKNLSAQLTCLSGDIELQGQSLKDYDTLELAKTLSLVLTESIQIPNLKVKELIAMGRFPYTNFWGKLNAKDQEKVDEAIAILSLNALADRSVIELSDGEKQKAMIAKALAQDTPLILLDEPTAFLDFPSKMAILAELRNIAHHKQVAIVLSTHDLELALKMADLIWLFPEKNVFKSGTPEDLVLSGEISKAFSNKILSFDLDTAHFVQRKETKDVLNVTGDSIEISWLKRALIRKGISDDTSRKMEIEVAYNDEIKKYMLTNANEKQLFFETIGDLLNEISNTRKTNYENS